MNKSQCFIHSTTLYKVGMKGIVIKVPDVEKYERWGFKVGDRVKVSHIEGFHILRCENEDGEWMPFSTEQILITNL
jgi:hypothetical protein